MNKIGIKRGYEGMDILRNVCQVADVSQSTIDKALKLKWPDFEDAIHYQAALATGCDAIVTRNPNNFQETTLPILSPQQFLAEIEKE